MLEIIEPFKLFISLFFTGSIAGTIDSIVGSGGLINMPALSLIFGIGPEAIATNKVASTSSALIALLVYRRKQKIDFNKGIIFVAWIILGSVLGSSLTPFIPTFIFKYFLMISCPLILWMVWKKDVWIKKEIQEQVRHPKKRWKSTFELNILLPALMCGLYDGLWGPGSGTFMFLSLLHFAKLPIFQSLAISKMASASSAAIALANYQLHGLVHWKEGSVLALGMCMGAFFGAQFAQKKSEKIIRPLLMVIIGLLIFRIYNIR